ncbi:MAG: zinc/iron-chelating domain-containing protein [Thermodesulfobacteriota bacterium]
MNLLITEQQTTAISLAGPEICANCSRIGPTCCRCETGEEVLVAPLSADEWERMQAMAPWTTLAGVVVREPNTAFFIEEMHRLFPDRSDEVAASFPLGGHHLRLAQNHLGQCACLGPAGCLLPQEARPHFCHLYPFWFFSDRLQVFGDPQCLALRSLQTADQLCNALHTTPQRLFDAYHALCLAWGVPRPDRSQAVDD